VGLKPTFGGFRAQARGTGTLLHKKGIRTDNLPTGGGIPGGDLDVFLAIFPSDTCASGGAIRFLRGFEGLDLFLDLENFHGDVGHQVLSEGKTHAIGSKCGSRGFSR